MPNPANVVIALAAAGLTVVAPVAADAQPQQPEGKVIVFVTEGSEISPAGTRLREYEASAACQAFPAGAHAIANTSRKQLLFYSDPWCFTPVPPPFNLISPGYGAHVSPVGSFRSTG
jgi:hypothetical protein